MFKELIKKKVQFHNLCQGFLFIYFDKLHRPSMFRFLILTFCTLMANLLIFFERENWLVFRPLLVNMRTGGKLEGLKDWDLSWRNEGQWGLGPKRKSSIRVSELSNHNPAGPPIRTTELSPFLCCCLTWKTAGTLKIFCTPFLMALKDTDLSWGFTSLS